MSDEQMEFKFLIPVAAPAVRVIISPLVFALIAELTAVMIWSCSAPIFSAISMQWEATKAAADEIAAEAMVRFFWLSLGFSDDAIDAAIATTAEATPTTDTAACN